MAKAKEGRGAPSVISAGQPAFVEDVTEARHGKQYAGARKPQPLDHVGLKSADSDPDTNSETGRFTRSAPRGTRKARSRRR